MVTSASRNEVRPCAESIASPAHEAGACFAAPGLHLTPKVTGLDAEVTVAALLVNTEPGDRVRIRICDADGRTVACGEGKSCCLPIENCRLWRGRTDPYLYTAEAELVRDGRVLDTASARFGCRTFAVDPEQGFILNGEPYPLRGVVLDADGPRDGRPDADIELICELGATTVRIRCGGHAQALCELCDQRGLVVLADIPCTRQSKQPQPRKLVHELYNHASIALWGISEDICSDGSEPCSILRTQNDLLHSLDATRLTTIDCAACKGDEPCTRLSDVISFGCMPGESPQALAARFDGLHATYPLRPIACTQYGCEADCVSCHEAYARELFVRSYLWATHLCGLFDRDAEDRSGLVSFDRRQKRDAFYVYKAWLSDRPFVHVCPRPLPCKDGGRYVTVYSNRPEVELFANGKSLGRQHAAGHVFRFALPSADRTQLLAVAEEARQECCTLPA